MGYGTEGSGTRGLLASVASVAPSKLCERERAQYGVSERSEHEAEGREG